MARLASQAKKGYFMTPPHLIQQIAKYITATNNNYILDPCCGTGAAIKDFANHLNIPETNVFGNELDGARFQDARDLLGPEQVTYGDAVGEISGTQGGLSLIYENPPYDFEGDGEGRTELKFLRHHYRFLKNMGVLVFVVPLTTLQRDEAIKTIPINFKNIRIFKFPDEDFKAFGQVVMFGQKNRGKTQKEAENYQRQINTPATLGDPCDVQYELPPTAGFRLTTRNLHISQIKELLNSKIGHKALDEGVYKEIPDRTINSLMPLRKGHQALLLATGAMDGEYQEPETGDTLIVHGETKMVTEVIEDDDERQTEVTKPVARVVGLNLAETAKKGGIVLHEYQ